MTKERRLGRGLAALLGEEPEPVSLAQVAAPSDTTSPLPANHDAPTEDRLHDNKTHTRTVSSNEAATAQDGDLLLLGVHEIDDNPFQPRREFSETEIASLAESLKAHDMLQPILVRRNGARWQLISGERRLRAAIQAGWTQIPARVRQADDRLVAELAIVENLQRKDLNAIEKALSFRRYLDQHHCKQEDLAQRLKIDRSTIANLMRLLELPDKVQQEIQSGAITMGHARAMLPLGDETLQREYSLQIQREGWSVRETERRVQEFILAEDGEGKVNLADRKRSATKPRSSHLASLEQQFRIQLGTKVDIRQTPRGKGQIVIHFKNGAEFERLQQLIAENSSDHFRREAS